MKRFHKLTVAQVRRETPEAVSILFEVPEDLAEDYHYVQGQHITLRANVNGEELRRSYSICTGVDDHELRIAVKHIEGGRFSGYANSAIEVGNQIDVFPPTGSFNTPLDAKAEKFYVAFAGGSGITPVLSIIRTTLATEPRSRFTLVYGNRDARSIIFAEAIGKLKDKYLGRFEVFHVLEGDAQDIPILQGRLDRDKCQALFERLIPVAEVDEFFICGPDPMMDAVEASLDAAAIDKARVHVERFIPAADVAPGSRPAPQEKKKARGDYGPVVSRVAAVIDGAKMTFEFHQWDHSLLDAAVQSGLRVPYSCTGGVCATCRAKVLKGEVKMAENYGLEQDEIDEGFILTCQSVPTSEELEISYDE